MCSVAPSKKGESGTRRVVLGQLRILSLNQKNLNSGVPS